MPEPTQRHPPLMKIYLGHAIGTAALGAMLPSGEHLQGLHAVTQPLLQWFPGAVSLSKQAPDPVFAQVFLALSLLIAICVLIVTTLHVSRGSYHKKVFESKKEQLKGYFYVFLFAIFVIGVAWNVPYSTDGAQTRAVFLTKAATSSKLGVVTLMNQLIVGGSLFVLLMALTMPFCTTVKRKIV